MEVKEHTRLDVEDPSQVGSARRFVTDLAQRIGMSESDVGRAALVATESASNVVKHGGGGFLLVGRPAAPSTGVEIIAVDRGRGMSSVDAALRDGHSTAGTSGTGLGGISRLADVFDVFSLPQHGTVLLAQVFRSGSAALPPGPRVGAVVVPKPGEEVSGDGWELVSARDHTTLLVVDGLGHGTGAAEAALTARQIFSTAAAEPPAEIVARLHAGLRPTRGAALAVAEMDFAGRRIRYAGIGNIAGCILNDGATRSLVSHHGTAGHDARRIQEFHYDFPAGAFLVMNSDGLLSSWSTAAFPGLLQRHPTVVAAMLYREFTRGRDDATVVVVEDAR